MSFTRWTGTSGNFCLSFICYLLDAGYFASLEILSEIILISPEALILENLRKEINKCVRSPYFLFNGQPSSPFQFNI